LIIKRRVRKNVTTTNFDANLGFLHFDYLVFRRGGRDDQRHVHVYNMPPDEARVVKSLMKKQLFGGYRMFIENTIVQVPPYGLQFHKETLNMERNCDRVLNVTAFFGSPWHPDNLFHLHNNGLFGLVQGIQSSKTCNPLTLVCNPPAKLFLLHHDPVRAARAHPSYKSVYLQLFGGAKAVELDVNLFTRRSGSTCIRNVVWGQGSELFYYSLDDEMSLTNRSQETLPLLTMRSASNAVWARAMNTSAESDGPETPVPLPLSLMVITRNLCKDRRRLNTDRVLPPLYSTSHQLGLNVTLFHDEDFARHSFFQLVRGTLKNTHILLGTHGAGLTNMLYLPTRRVVIEIYPRARAVYWLPIHRNMAWARGHLYIALEAELQTKAATSLSASPTIVQCALLLAHRFLKSRRLPISLDDCSPKLSNTDRYLITLFVPSPLLQLAKPTEDLRQPSDLVTVHPSFITNLA